MTFSAIAYDTQNGEPRNIEHPRFVDLTKGKPNSIVAENGMRYYDFKLQITTDDGTLINYKR